MSMLAPILFLGAAVFAVALAWYSIGDARLAAIDTVKQAFRPTGAQEITVTFPAEATSFGMPSSDLDDLAFARRNIRRSRSRVQKMPSHRLHAFSRPRHAA